MKEKLNKTKVLRISEVQYRTLKKMEERNVDISKFIRAAIKEKIIRDYRELMPKPEKTKTPWD